MNSQNFTDAARNVLLSEAKAIESLSKRLGKEFEDAVNLILGHKGKVIISGVGKSGWIGRKMAATLTSTGTPAVFLHACEAVHGDLGIYEAGDPTILISNSGATSECLRIMPVLKSFGYKNIALVGNQNSPMARDADITLDASFEREGDPIGIVPTTSTTTALAFADAIACALMAARNFSKEDFARFHPAGQLGRNLTYKVSDVMQ
ncbi:MAG: SIS domain-containing protein, partial [Opitutales bacterium]|nr:SIS domain-containing protein [Opitutales bacterium]